MKKIKILDQEIKLNDTDKVFEPNITTRLIMQSCDKLNFNKKKKVLDLGSGSGIIGIFLKKKYKEKIDLYLSDYSEDAVKAIKLNLKINKIKGIVKKSNILNNWKVEKFDLIINDISAIDKEIADKYWYNKFIPHDCGKDGIKLSKIFLMTVQKNLNKNGIILMPVISLSNHKKITSIFQKKFKTKLLIKKEWPAPKKFFLGKEKAFIRKKYLFKKFDMFLCFTKIYKLKFK